MLPREFAAVVPVVAAMLAIGVYPKVVLDRVNPTSDGVVAWVNSVDVDQSGIPGGLRAEVRPHVPGDTGAVAARSPSAGRAP
jgi:hypothetical protein